MFDPRHNSILKEGVEVEHEVLCQLWDESERGWGIRPDGYSLHLDRDSRQRYIDSYWSRMPKSVPDEYSRPDGDPYWCMVSQEVYDEICASPNGIREFKNDWPKPK